VGADRRYFLRGEARSLGQDQKVLRFQSLELVEGPDFGYHPPQRFGEITPPRQRVGIVGGIGEERLIAIGRIKAGGKRTG